MTVSCVVWKITAHIPVLNTATETLELESSVKHSIDDITTLADFLSTFQQSLLSTSSQISSLQTKSAEIDEQLSKQKTQAKEIDELLKELVIPPSLINLIMNKDLTDVDAWIDGCKSIEGYLRSVEKHQDVKARVQLQTVLQVLKMKVSTFHLIKYTSKCFRLPIKYVASCSACLHLSKLLQLLILRSIKQQYCLSMHLYTLSSKGKNLASLKKSNVCIPTQPEGITRLV